MAKVSILMNCFNGERYLKEAIDSVYAQTYSDWEIIFIDNASTDRSAEIAKSYDHRLKYYKIEKTIPLYSARNFALQYITGEFLAFLDTDDFWVPDKLSMQLDILEKYPEVYLICSGFICLNERRGKILRYIDRRLTFITPEKAIRDYPINIPSVMLRRDAHSIEKIRFEPTLNLTGDYELFVKFVYWYRAYYIAKPLVTWRIHSANLSGQLIHDWHKELAETHTRWDKEFGLSPTEKISAEKRYLKALSLAYMVDKKYTIARKLAKKYLFRDLKLSLIYLSTLNSFLSKKLLKTRNL